MTSFKVPDISVSALEASRAMKKLSETLLKAKEIELKSKSLIFKVQVVSVFPKWYSFTTFTTEEKGLGSVIEVKEETIQTTWTFTPDIYTKSAIKERISEFEEYQKVEYQSILNVKYKELPPCDIVPKIHYILEVNTK